MKYFMHEGIPGYIYNFDPQEYSSLKALKHALQARKRNLSEDFPMEIHCSISAFEIMDFKDRILPVFILTYFYEYVPYELFCWSEND